MKNGYGVITHLNANSSFKVIHQTRYPMVGRTDGQSGDYCFTLSGA